MRSLIALLIAVLALSITAPQVQAVKRNILGTSSGWMPLKELAAQVGMSEDYMNQIIDANFTFSCPYTRKDGKVIMGPLNAWALNDDIQHIYTSAHGVLEKKAKLKQDLADCRVKFTRDEMNNVEPVDYRVDVRTGAIDLGLRLDANGTVVEKFNVVKDRARLRLLKNVPGANALSTNPGQVKLQVGQKVMAVSSGKPFGSKGLLAQTCTNMTTFDARGGQPGALFTDCHNQGGVSGMLYFVEDLGSCRDVAGDKQCDWIPVAMHSGGFKKDPDNSPWNLETNTSIGIVIDEFFFTYAE